MSKRFKSPGGSSSPARPPERRGLPHSLSCQTDGRKRRNTSRKISTGSRNLPRFMPSPATPTYNAPSSHFLLSLYLHSPHFTSTFFVSPTPSSPACVPFLSRFFYPAPAHPAPVASSFLLLCTCKIAAHKDIKTR